MSRALLLLSLLLSVASSKSEEAAASPAASPEPVIASEPQAELTDVDRLVDAVATVLADDRTVDMVAEKLGGMVAERLFERLAGSVAHKLTEYYNSTINGTTKRDYPEEIRREEKKKKDAAQGLCPKVGKLLAILRSSRMCDDFYNYSLCEETLPELFEAAHQEILEEDPDSLEELITCDSRHVYDLGLSTICKTGVPIAEVYRMRCYHRMAYSTYKPFEPPPLQEAEKTEMVEIDVATTG